MRNYLRYYISVPVLIAAIYGFYRGGNAVYAAIITFPVLTILDIIFPHDLSVRKMNSKFWAMLPVWICTLLALGLYGALAWRVGQGNMSTGQLAGSIAGVAWLSVVPTVPSSHELYHQRNRLAVFVGRFAQVCYLDCTRDVAHVIGHHLDVSTPADSDTARRGQDLYSFTLGAIIASTRASMRVESDRLEKNGQGRWSLGHRLYKALAALIVAQSIIYAIGGWAAVAVAMATMMLARLWVESFNYFQHYGQVRVEGTPITRRHVWNHLGTIGRACAFEITNHAEHHLDTYKPYYALTPDSTAVRLPSVFLCFLTALIPPLWHRAIIMPALKKWDLLHASPAERELARAQNLAAGWPDWFDQSAETEPAMSCP